MPSKFRKALGAVKDQTSISIAKVANNNASNLEVVILKATRHDEAPIDERYVSEVLAQISSDKACAGACARAIARRIGKTRNWIVALKSLMLILRIFQDGDPYFPKEVLHAMKRGAKILNLSSFRDDSNSSPWDYTAFVRCFALYLDERLDCFLTGKLQRRYVNNKERVQCRTRSRNESDSISDLKPVMLLNKISSWQKLLDRAVATRPTGAAKTNRLVQICFYAIVQESFDLYRDISDGLALLLDSFFHLKYQSCVSAFQTCVKASKQFEELCSFYDFCKSIGVGRISEYPSVQKISEELVETLQEFLKDQSSFQNMGRSPTHLLLPALPTKGPSSSSEAYEQFSERDSEFASQCTSLEDLMSVTDVTTSPSKSMDRYLEQFEKQSQPEDVVSATDSGSVQSNPFDQGTLSTTNSALDLVSLDGWPPEEHCREQEQAQQASELDSNGGQRDEWQLVLAGTSSQPIKANEDADNPSATNNLFDQDLTPVPNGFPDQSSLPELHYNPFLQDITKIPATPASANEQSPFPEENLFLQLTPTLEATPTSFSTTQSRDFFRPCSTTKTSTREFTDPFDTLFLPNTNQTPPVVANSNNQAVSPFSDVFSGAPTFQATPTFSAQNPEETMGLQNQDDPFAPFPYTHECNGSLDQSSLMHQQQLWLQQQDKIIAKNMC